MIWNTADPDWNWQDWGPDATPGMYWADTAAPPYNKDDPPGVAATSWSHGGTWSSAYPPHMQPGRRPAKGDVRCHVKAATIQVTTNTMAVWPPPAMRAVTLVADPRRVRLHGMCRHSHGLARPTYPQRVLYIPKKGLVRMAGLRRTTFAVQIISKFGQSGLKILQQGCISAL